MTHDEFRSKRTFFRNLLLAYGVVGGPLAWLSQINVDYPLVATPCFPGPERRLSFPSGADWAFAVAIAVYVGLFLFALGAGLVSRSSWKRLGEGISGSGDHFEDSGSGLTRMLAFWGMLLGFGFSIVILLNAFALLTVPPCAL